MGHTTRQTKRTAQAPVPLSPSAWTVTTRPVRDAMAHGLVSEVQATVIVKGVEKLPVEHRA